VNQNNGDAISQEIGSSNVNETRPHVVIVGAGFGGLYAARTLAKLPIDVTIVDKKNHHTFQPLLYQVAMAVLSPAEIATPIRAIFRGKQNIKVLLGEVVNFDLDNQEIKLKDAMVTLKYDYLVVAAGAGHAYFGHDEWSNIAPGLKTVEDALEIRRRVLFAFEEAERRAAATGMVEMLNFVIVGGGPTGVELAGALADIARRVMAEDFRYIDPKQARVILLEGGPRVLAAYPPDLSASAEKQLRELGVEVRTNTVVTAVEPHHVCIGDEVLPSAVTMWAAGVAASQLGKKLGAKTDRAGRVLVANDLTIPGHRNVFVIGDLAAYTNPDGTQLPGVAPAAIQTGKFVGEMIAADLRNKPRKTFQYFDKGSLATIGRSKAVGQIRQFHFSGYLAWLAWLFVHIMFLIGFRNRFFVMLEWAFTYFSYQRAARLITDKQ
jgi:NADH dehydrogenase